MANRFLNNITINDQYTFPSTDGTNGQILSTTGAADGTTELVFVDQSTLNSGSAERTEILVKNVHGSALSKGDPVYIVGSVGASDRLEVALADASDAAKMPCVGLLTQDLANNGEGTATVTGKLRNLITSPIDGATPTENDTLYVKPGGGLTLTKPTGVANLIQNVGQVGRVSTSSDGNIVVSAILRSNDVPNLTTGKIWVGSAANTIESATVHLDETNGRMGIGTTSPSSTLQVGGGSVDSSFRTYYNDNTYAELRGYGINFNRQYSYLRPTNDNSNFLYIGSQPNTWNELHLHSNTITFSDNTSEVMRINPGGNVGIGTTTPGEKLHVYGRARIQQNGQTLDLVGTDHVYSAWYPRGTSNGRKAYMGYGGASTTDFTVMNEDNGAFVIGTNNAERMRIISTGNVGIGATSPNAKLDVSGNIKTTAGGAWATSSGGVQLTYDGTVGYLTTYYDSNSLVLGAGVSQKTGIYINGQSAATNDIKFKVGNSTRVTFDSGGNVGIGTESPQQKLQVASPSDTSVVLGASYLSTNNNNFFEVGINANDGYLNLKNSGVSTTVHIDSDGDSYFNGGNVGIGTASPSGSLNIRSVSATGSEYNLLSQNNSGTQLFYVRNDGVVVVSNNYFYVTSSQGAYFDGSVKARGGITDDGGTLGLGGGGNTNHLNILTSGNVGIGTTSASTVGGTAKMTIDVGASTSSPVSIVNGTTDGMYIRRYSTGGSYELQTTVGSGNSGNLSLQSYGGNVGIGTTTPGAKLDVKGSATIGNSGGFLQGDSPKLRLRNMTALPGGYIEADTFNFRFDESATAYAGESFAIGGTISQTTGTAISDANLKRLFTYTAGYINLNTHKDSNNNVVIELDGISVSNSANTYWKPYVFFHASASNVATMTIEVKNGAGNWETVENAIDCVDFYIRDGFYQTSQGVLKGARFTFTNITGNSYLRMIGVIGKTHASYQWNVLKSGSKMFGDLDFGDTKRATFGDDEDLKILHESNNSYIHHTGSGSLYMKADTGNIQIINYTNDSDIVLASDDGSGGTTPYLTIDGSATHAYFSNPGNVGIGTTSPVRKLQVEGGDFYTNDKSDTAGASVGYGGNSFQIRNGSTSEDLNFDIFNRSTLTWGTPVVIKNSGNVGIGTSSPSEALHVVGNGIFTGEATVGDKLYLTNVSSSGADGILAFDSTDTAGGSRIFSFTRGSGNSLKYHSYGYHLWQSGAAGGTSDSTNRMILDSSGRLGIGTTSPGYQLETTETIRSTGIGSAPSTGSGIELRYTADGAGSILAYNRTTGSTGYLPIRVEGSTIDLREGGSSVLYIDGGDVGIGTTSPAHKLHVVGNGFYTGGLQVGDSSADTFTTTGHTYLATIGNNVGIGTTSPGYKLDVSGGARAGGVVTYSKTYTSLDTTGNAVAGLTTGSNGNSAGFTFTCFGHTGDYQKIVYSCYNVSGTWNTKKVIDEGTNAFDVEASANAATITFTFKSTSGTKSYSPRVTVEATGSAINSTYA